MKEPSPSQSRHRASRKGRDSEALRDWNDEFHEAVYRCNIVYLSAVGPVTLVFLREAQECSTRVLLIYGRVWIKHVSRQCVTGTGFVSPDNLPPSDEEDDEEDQLVSGLKPHFCRCTSIDVDSLMSGTLGLF